jgi:hypothetical protein
MSRPLLGIVGIAVLAAFTPACAQEFDTSRALPKRGTVGEEMFGVICDRVGAQALREDLTGESFRNICHKNGKGEWADKVDEEKLPRISADAVDEKGKRVSVDEQKANRSRAVGKIEALGRRRADLIRAFDATFPEQKIPIKDIDNPDETKSCDAPKQSGEGLLTEQIADMLGRMGDLYNDGTIPQSTESLGKVVAAFQNSPEAQAAWARLSARQGYRPIETALGATRPMIAYPHLRDLANASLRLLSADSDPYQRDPKRASDGSRIPVPGPGNAALVKMLEASHEELLAAKVDPKPILLTSTVDPAGRAVLSRPRDNLEIMQEILFASDPTFGGGTPHYIVKRDARGYAAITGGQVPAPFIDADKDGLPDVDDVGRFKTTNGSLAPSPFPFPGGADGTRDQFGRALAGNQLLYQYIDTSHTFGAQVLNDLKPLVNPDPEAKHETLMDMMGGLRVAMGPRVKASKPYAGGKTVEYDGISVKDSPILDLVYAMSVILSDKTADQTLALAKELFTTKSGQMARVTGAMLKAMDVAQKHPEAKIPKTATFWDENLDVMAQIAKEPGLLEDVLQALAEPATADLGNIMAKYARNKDEITYNKNDINGPTWNLTTNSASEPRTAVDRGQAPVGKNRSIMYRFLQAISDTIGVTACNKPDAKVHALGISIPGTYKECEVFKIENMAAFYLDAIGNASQYPLGPGEKVPRGTIYMRPGLLRLAPGVAGIIEDSSGIQGMWPAAGSIVPPKPEFLNRLVFFDQQNDTQNAKTRLFVSDLQGEFIGTSVCPERVIDDPDPGALDANPDKKIRGLRNCPNGQWLQQRDANALFPWESYGFYDAIRPLLGAFIKHRREDLFLALSASAYKHWPGPDSAPDDCKLPNGKTCPKANMMSYEALIAEAFAGDVLPAINALVRELKTLPITRCDAVSASGACTKTSTISGIDVVAAATRATLDPDYAKAQGIKDRRGGVTAKRNDGTTNPQVTPAYLLTQALNAIDDAFDQYEQTNPTDRGERRAGWKRARSQLVDQFLTVNGTQSSSAFANPTMSKMTPIILDILRSQLLAHCPQSFTPTSTTACEWAKSELTKKAEETIGGPLMASGLDVMEAIRGDAEGRKQMELLLQYLLDAASKNDALASTLASVNDLVQLMRDDENLVPLYHVLAEATGASVKDEQGRILEKSLVDAQMALLSRISGRYFDEKGVEICKREVDPNQVLAVALGNLVTPIKDGDFKGQSPLEVIIDVIADVNRVDPTLKYEGTLAKEDYQSVSANIFDFLMNKERGLEQFYEVIRQGTKF